MALELEIDSQILADKYDSLMRRADVPGYAEAIEDKAQHLKNLAASIKQGDIDFLGANIQSIIKDKEKTEFLGEAFAVWRQLAMFPHKKREDELLSGEDEMFGIYQLRTDLPNHHDIAFASMNFMRKHDKKIEPNNYELVYAGNLYATDDKSESEILEQLFERFNIDRPESFAGHSLSMSDVVVLNRDGNSSAHYVDRIGYEALPEFVEGREHIIDYNWYKDMEDEKHRNHQNEALGGNGDFDNVTDMMRYLTLRIAQFMKEIIRISSRNRSLPC